MPNIALLFRCPGFMAGKAMCKSARVEAEKNANAKRN
jgi:hypothetical protein